jgi:hypothetical protein
VFEEYKAYTIIFKELMNTIVSAQSSVVDINNFLDQFCHSHKNYSSGDIEVKMSQILKGVYELNLSDDTVGEDDECSNKENSTFTDHEEAPEEYFSPNIQIRKSTSENTDLYTPALKRNRKN